ncbi:MAG: hypothetical protein UHX00_05675 [Caryophanon sp.]|nr:hypothetical protein [Caryophanon sp.]
MKKYMQLLILLSAFFIYTVGTSAAQWTKTDVDAAHTWSITFNEEVDEVSFKEHAALYNAQQQKQVFAAKKTSATVIEIEAPTEGYVAGERYELVIPTAVTSAEGVALQEESILTFTVKEMALAELPEQKPEEVEEKPELIPLEEEPQPEPAPEVIPESEPQVDGLTANEQELAKRINAYRESLGLKRLTISKSLTAVARAHVVDSNAYNPGKETNILGQKCNLHSWSANGDWVPLCYTPDHLYAALMWSKPRELTDYKGNGYEISTWTNGKMAPGQAFELWRKSAGHEQLMASRGAWSMLTTMGVGIDGGYAHVWFGSDRDPAGYYDDVK